MPPRDPFHAAIAANLSETRVTPPFAEDHVFRASFIPKMCARAEVIRALDGITLTEQIDADLGLTFAFGHAVHWMLQNKVFAAVIKGRWRCVSCGATHYNPDGFGIGGWVLRPSVCGKPRAKMLPDGTGIFLDGDGRPVVEACTGTDFLFLETQLTNADLGISGTADGAGEFLLNGVRFLGEFKTMESFKFDKNVRTATDEHRMQATIYAFLSGVSTILVVVFCKTIGTVTSTFRGHPERYQPAIMENVRRKIGLFREGVATRTLPPRVCHTPDCDFSRKCPVSDRCWRYA